MSPRRTVPWLFVVACGALLAWELYAIFVRAEGTPSSLPAGTPQRMSVWDGLTVSQTMTLEAEGFSSISIRARPEASGSTGLVIIELAELQTRETFRPLYRWSARIDEIGTGQWHTSKFPPVENSAGRQYRVQIQTRGAPAGRGISLDVNRGGTYLGGMLFVDGREQWGDLAFQTSATRSTVFRRFEDLLGDRPRVMRSRVTLGAAFLLYNWALVTFAYELMVPGTKNGERRTKNGERRTENEERRTENGERRTKNSHS